MRCSGFIRSNTLNLLTHFEEKVHSSCSGFHVEGNLFMRTAQEASDISVVYIACISKKQSNNDNV